MASDMNGAELGLAWAVPFAGILLSIALFPLFAPHIWHHHFGKISVFWALCCIIPLATVFGPDTAFHEIAHVLLADYVPFIIFVGSLFIVAGGIHVRGSFVGRPIVNTAILALGAVLANFMGTTGAAMLLIRPLIGANENRRRKVHTFIFFIFLVANVGGALTPLGDPPLFLGFLKGDSFMFSRDVKDGFKAPEEKQAIGVDGGINILFLAAIVGTVLMSGFWRSGVDFTFLGVHFSLEGVLRDALFIVISGASLLLTTKATREANHFSWDPILEVAKLFFGIFCCIVPVLAMLRAGHDGHFAPLVALVTNAGGDPTVLMGEGAKTLMAISMGSVFMGAVTYIGNAPNFMTVSICNERGIKMPTFFGYMLWSVTILFPTFFLMDMLFLI